MRTPRIPWRQPDVPSPVPATEAAAFGDRLLRDRDACAAQRDHLQAVIEEVRNVLRASTLFIGNPVEDVVIATDLLATAYEAERSRP